MRRSPFIQSSASALLLSPVISCTSASGYVARICHSSSASRTILNVTFALAMWHYGGNLDESEPTFTWPASFEKATPLPTWTMGRCRNSSAQKARRRPSEGSTQRAALFNGPTKRPISPERPIIRNPARLLIYFRRRSDESCRSNSGSSLVPLRCPRSLPPSPSWKADVP
jgi:hypothetical protein